MGGRHTGAELMAWATGWNVLNTDSAQAADISQDGTVVVGWATVAGRVEAFRWTDGTETALVSVSATGDYRALGTNADGSVVVGTAQIAIGTGSPYDGSQAGFSWTAGGGMVLLALPATATASTANAISGDGTVIVGTVDMPTPADGGATKWVSGTPSVLPKLAGGTQSVAYDVSADGAVIVGVSDATDGFTHAVRWTGAGVADLGFQLGGNYSIAYGVSADGTTVVGEGDDSGFNAHGFRWTVAGGMDDLGLLPDAGTYAIAYGASETGTVIAGQAGDATHFGAAFRWTVGGGMALLPDVADNAVAVSGDGLRIAGITEDGPFSQAAAVYLSPDAPPLDPNFPLPSGVIKVLLPPAELQFCDANGVPFAGGTLEFYVQDSTTPKETWNSPLGGDDHLNPNPLVLDSAGRAIIYGDGAYRTVLRDSTGTLIWDQPSFTYISAAMVPVVGAATLADARQAMGITDAIEAEAEARAAADSAEQSARIAADVALGVRIDDEIARAEAAEAHLQSEIDGLPAPAPPGNTVGGEAQLDASGHKRVTFATPFATSCDSFVVTGNAIGVWSGAFNIGQPDRFGCDVWGSIFGSRTPASNVVFMWLAIGT